MLFQPLIDVLVPFLPGYIELPESYGAQMFALAKGAFKYIKRVPKPGGGYRYFYKVGHGGTVANADHFVEGAAFQHEGGHFHIKSVDGDKLTIEHDETGEKKTISKSQLRGMLAERHGKELDAHRAKVHADLADARKAGASAKQIARLEARAKAAGDAGKSSEELRADVERTKAELDKVIGDIMVIANKKELRPGDKAKIKEWLNLVAKHGRDGTPVPAMNKRDVYGKHKHSIMWAYSDDSRGLAGVRQDRVYDAAKAHGDAMRAAGPEQETNSKPDAPRADAGAVASGREKDRASAATETKAAGAVPKTDEKDGRKPTHVGFNPSERNFEYVGRNDDGTIRVRNEGGSEFDLTKKESDNAHLSYAPPASTQVQHIDPKKMSRVDYIRAEIDRLKASRAARVQDAEAAIADLVKVKLPVGIGPVQYLQSKTRPTKQESAALVSHRVAEKALKGDYHGDTYHFGRVWDMAHGKKDDHPGFSYGKD